MVLILNDTALPHPDEMLISHLLQHFKVVHRSVVQGNMANMDNPLEYHTCIMEATEVLLSIPNLTLSFGSELFAMYLDLFALWLSFLEDDMSEHLTPAAISLMEFMTQDSSTTYPLLLNRSFCFPMLWSSMLFFPHNCSATATCPSHPTTTCLPSSPSASRPYQQPSRTPNDAKHGAPPASHLPPPPSPPLAPPTPSGGVQMMAVVKEEGAQQILQVFVPHPWGPSHWCTNCPELRRSGLFRVLLTLPPPSPSSPSATPSRHPTPPGAVQQRPWCMNGPELRRSGTFRAAM
ncbi:unnamed protein product [Cyclocybe aegerita]|uniref:Uncharacterized protein n=1 Tax=Cyclocybe aegerita TaxID=1973307 RepID=A0A8S0W213_CYCAE|nr:unnamed protein product [Cyclocybe aegerita]